MIFMQPDRYGGFDESGYFITATIPPFYQKYTQEGNLPGCIVKDDQLHEQCRTGKYHFNIGYSLILCIANL